MKIIISLFFILILINLLLYPYNTLLSNIFSSVGFLCPSFESIFNYIYNSHNFPSVSLRTIQLIIFLWSNLFKKLREKLNRYFRANQIQNFTFKVNTDLFEIFLQKLFPFQQNCRIFEFSAFYTSDIYN